MTTAREIMSGDIETLQVRRLPVIDGRELVGMVSQADVAVHCPPEQVAQLVSAISAAP